MTNRPDPGQEELAATTERRREQYSHAIIRSAITTRDGEWKNCATTVQFGRGEAPESLRFNYSGFEIHQVAVAPDQVMSFVDAILGEETLMLENRSVPLENPRFDKLGGQSLGQRVSANDAWIPTDWPGDQFHIYAPSQVNPPSKPLLGASLPAYPDGFAAIEHILGVDVSGGTRYDGGVYFLLPDYRAQISSVSMGVESVTIKLARGYSPSSLLTGKVYAWGPQQQVFHQNIEEVQLGETIAIGFHPERVYIAIMAADQEDVVDQWELSPFRPNPKLEIDLSNPAYVDQLVSQGENTTVEFKPGIRSDDAKMEWAETAIAFANTVGGAILIGVDDNGRIEGVHGGEWSDIILESLRDRSEPPVRASVHAVALPENKTVYVLQVTQSADRPHLMKGKGTVYVRIGSTDKPATRHELDVLYRRDPGLPEVAAFYSGL